MNKNRPFLSISGLTPYLAAALASDAPIFRHARPMQGLLEAGPDLIMVALANEARHVEAVPLTGLSNEIDAATGDGWARIPYGEWPHEQGLQRFGRAEAEAMVGYFKNTWNRIKRAVVGMPIFRGHPDLAAVANEYPDKGVYGTIADLEARGDGLYLRPILSEAGALLVNEQGLKFFSPHWLARKLPDEAGKPVFAPAFLVSIGLTARPNIAGTSLVNAQPQPATTTMPPWLLLLLGLANEATEAQVTAKVTDLLARPETTALANEKTRADGLAAEIENRKSEIATLTTALANAQSAHAETLIASAIAAGRITEAQKPVWLARLQRDFAAESVALGNEAPGTAVKIAPRTAALGARKAASPAAEQFHALVNARTAQGEGYQAAWAAVKATPQGKALVAQMEPVSAA